MAAEMEFWSWPPRHDDSYRPAPQARHWFPVRETMDPGERDARILERIRQVMRYAWENAPFYRRKWEEAGVHPDHVRSLEDFERVPVVTKAELRAAQAASPPFGDYLCVPEDQVRHVHGTSGTTGRPTAFGICEADWRGIANFHARALWGMGLRSGQTHFIGSFFSLYLGSWGALIGAERLGARVFPFGAGAPGQTQRAVMWLREMRPDAFYGTPSYAIHLAEVAQSEGVNPRDFGIRFLYFSGEPGASIPTIRDRIAELYGGRVFDTGSMAEMSPWMHLAETKEVPGMTCWQDTVYTEVSDPTTHTRVAYGREGTPVYTHLERLSQPMIRLLSNDLSRWEFGPRADGRTYPVLPRGVYGRVDDMFTVRGENVYPSAIDEVVMGLEHYGGEHRILVTRDRAMDELEVQIEFDATLQALGAGPQDGFGRRVQDQLRKVLGIRAHVELLPPGTLPRTEFKARRVIDKRDILHGPAAGRP
jgi:phenylacetate-CoA ligase